MKPIDKTIIWESCHDMAYWPILLSIQYINKDNYSHNSLKFNIHTGKSEKSSSNSNPKTLQNHYAVCTETEPCGACFCFFHTVKRSTVSGINTSTSPSLAAVLLINEVLKAARVFPSGHCIKRHQQDWQINQSGKYTDIKGDGSTSTDMEEFSSSTWRTLKNDTGGFNCFDYRGPYKAQYLNIPILYG